MYLPTFRICLEINGLDPARFLPASGLAWQAALKKTKAILDLLTDIGMLYVISHKCERWNMLCFLLICQN